MRIFLAIRAFFAILFGKSLAPDILLAAVVSKDASESSSDSHEDSSAPVEANPQLQEHEARARELEAKIIDLEAELKEQSSQDDHAAAAVQVLAVMQSEARLLDFISEDITDYSDEDVGAAVRDVHRGLQAAFKDHFPVTAVRDEEEDSPITIPEGFNPHEVRLVGNVVGQPPFSGTLNHRGWRVEKVQLPKLPGKDAALIASPAEVEI